MAEQIGREAELRPDDKPKLNVNGIEEVVADKGYHSGAVVERVKSYEVRSYIPEKKQKGRRHWAGKAEEQRAVYQNRQRVRGELRDWLPEDHLAYFFSEVIDQLDLRAIELCVKTSYY